METLCVYECCSFFRLFYQLVCEDNVAIDHKLVLLNRIKESRTEANISQQKLADMVGVSRNTISSIEMGHFNPTAKLALLLCIALEKKFEDLFYFQT